MRGWTGLDLRRARVESGLSQSDVIGGAGIPRWRISQLERAGDDLVLTAEEERRAKTAIAYLGDLARKRREFIARNRHDPQQARYHRHLKTVEDRTEEAEAEPAIR